MRTATRSEFLHLLESVSPGLSVRDIIEQSSCFVFQNGEVMTYNDEIACRAKTSLKLTGAIQARPLKAILEKLSEDELQVTTNESEFLIHGKRRKAGIRMEKEVLLPIDSVDKPAKFKPLHEDFLEAISMCVECVGKDEQKFWTTCVHLHPKWIEACDNYQITRYKMKTGFQESCLVRGTSIKHLINLEMTHFSETEAWLHFRNSGGLILSCRRYIEEYRSKELATRMFQFEGVKTTFPKGLGEATDRANVFSEENVDNNQVYVEIRPGKLKVRGEGVSGWYSEIKKLRYKGPALDFMISPKLLQNLTRKHNECEITDDKLKVNGGKFTYASVLEKVGDSDEDEEQEESNKQEEQEE